MPSPEPFAFAQPEPARRQALAATDRITLPRTFVFDYRDSHGNETSRVVTVDAISQSGEKTYLEGLCHTYNEARTFRTDNIIGKLTDRSTGEIIAVKRLLGDVRARKEMTRNAGWQTAVYFAGFGDDKYWELSELAENAGWQVRSTLSRTVDYMVGNGRAGAKQAKEAESLGIQIIDEDTFRVLL
jgi:hypothetical protein